MVHMLNFAGAQLRPPERCVPVGAVEVSQTQICVQMGHDLCTDDWHDTVHPVLVLADD